MRLALKRTFALLSKRDAANQQSLVEISNCVSRASASLRFVPHIKDSGFSLPQTTGLSGRPNSRHLLK
jgi:hypothetical protein